VLGSDGRAVTNEKQWSGTRAGANLLAGKDKSQKDFNDSVLTFCTQGLSLSMSMYGVP